jgi:carbon-monoxide dehydrogenase medium subunit
MKPRPFEYVAPTSADEVLAVLAEAPDETTLLAGGQSLMPIMNMRLAEPRVLVDLNRIAELGAIERTPEGGLRLGSMVRQRELETDRLVRRELPLMTEAAHNIAHLAIRMRGTVGGSLAHVAPAAELPAAFSALDCRLLVRGGDGDRALMPGDFFVGPFTSALEEGELLVAVEVDAPPSGAGWAFLEVARTHGAFALAGAAALLRADEGGAIDFVRLALCGVGGVPFVPAWLDEAALGERPDRPLFERIGERVGDEVEPFDDVHATAAYRKRLAGVLAARALAAAATRSRDGGAPAEPGAPSLDGGGGAGS